MAAAALNRGDIVAEARSAFGFLEHAGGRSVEVDDGAWRTVLAYTVGSITIEVELDWREGAVFVLVCRTVNGRRPPGYYMHDGRRMRVQLTDVLDGGNEQDRAAARRLRDVVHRSGADAMRAQVLEYSAVMRGESDRIGSWHERLFAH